MEPIINPLWFYLINITDNLSIILMVIWIFFAIALSLLSLVMGYEYAEGCISETEKRTCKKYFKFILKIFIPCTVILTFIPSSDTIYKMIIAKNLTLYNIEVAGDTLKDGVNYIFDKIENVTLKEIDEKSKIEKE